MSSSNCSRNSRVRDGAGLEEELVGQSALAVIDVGDDREIPDELGVDNHIRLIPAAFESAVTGQHSVINRDGRKPVENGRVRER